MTTRTKANTLANAASPAAHAYDTATTTNPEGHKAFERTLHERVVQVLTTGTLDSTFYANADKVAAEADAVLRDIVAKDPAFLAKAIDYARNESYLRTMPMVGLVYLSTAEDKAPFKQVFPRVVRTPNDLAEFMTFASHGGLRNPQSVTGKGKPSGAVGVGLGRAQKRAIADWLNGMTEYHAIKYGGESGQFSLKNIIKVAHPKADSERTNALFRYARGLDMTVEQRNLLPQVLAFEGLKVTTDPALQRTLIEAGRLPHEVVTGTIKPDTATWAYIMRQMPHLALLRHLNTLERNGVFKDEANVAWAVARLTDETAIAKAKVLPFQYFAAYVNYTSDHGLPANAIHWAPGHVQRMEAKAFTQDIADAITTALEASFVNMPDIDGNVVIGVDVSPSMIQQTLTEKGTMTAAHVAAIFTAALMKKCKKVRVIAFSQVVTPLVLSKNDTILTNAKAIVAANNGGTNVGIPMHEVNQHGYACDVFIGITDNVEWATKRLSPQFAADGFYGEWVQRKNKNAKAFLLTVTPNPGAVAPVSDPSCQFIFGWSDKVPTVIANTLAGLGDQVKQVRERDISSNPRLWEQMKAESAARGPRGED